MNRTRILVGLATTVFFTCPAGAQSANTGDHRTGDNGTASTINTGSGDRGPAPGNRNANVGTMTGAQANGGNTHGQNTGDAVGRGSAAKSASDVATSKGADSAVANSNGNGRSGPSHDGANGHTPDTPPPPNPHSDNPDESANSAAVEAVLHQFDAARDQYVTQRTTLVNQLASAKTDPDRQKVIDELRNQQQTLQAEQRATAKEIRNDLETLRRQHGGG